MKKISGLFVGTVALLSLTQALDASAAPASRAAREAALVAALPPPQDSPAVFQSSIEGEIGRLSSLNPGKGNAVRAILTRDLACKLSAFDQMAQRSRPQAVHTLSDDTLARLTTLFSGPDSKRIAQLQDKENPTQAEQAEAAAIGARYKKPMSELGAALQKTTSAIIGSPDYMALLQTCADAMAGAFKKENIRTD